MNDSQPKNDPGEAFISGSIENDTTLFTFFLLINLSVKCEGWGGSRREGREKERD